MTKDEKEYNRMIREIANNAAKAIGFKKKFIIQWIDAETQNKLDLMAGIMNNAHLVGINLTKMTGDKIIGLDKDYCLRTSLNNVIRLVAHEVVHFRVDGHGKDFKDLEKKALKPFKNFFKK